MLACRRLPLQLRQPVRQMSRVGKVPMKVPEGVTVKFEPIPPEQIPVFKLLSPNRVKYSLKNRPAKDGFAAFGPPHRLTVTGPLGTLQWPLPSYLSIVQEATDAGTVLSVKVQCDGATKLGRTLWGTTRSHVASAIKGVTQGHRKDLELHGIGFRGRVVPSTEAAPPVGEREVRYRLGVEKYGESPYRKHPGPAVPEGGHDITRGGALYAGAGGGWKHRRPPLQVDGVVPLYRAARRNSGGSVYVDGGGILLGKGTVAGESGGLNPRIPAGGDTLMLRLGYGHESRVDFPPHLTVSTPTPTTISIFGIDKQQVGLAASRVRLLRKPDVYKGKGVRYVGEVVTLKQIKK